MMGHDENDNNYVSTLYDLYVCTCTGKEKRIRAQGSLWDKYESEDIQTAQNLSIPKVYLHVYNSPTFCQPKK